MDLREIVTNLRDAIEGYDLAKELDSDPTNRMKAADDMADWAFNLVEWLDEHGILPEDLRNKGEWTGYAPRDREQRS